MTIDDLTTLTGILGPAGVLTAPTDCAPYEEAARYAGGRAAAVARPATVAELSSTVAYAVRNKIAVVPQSGNTGLVRGSTPDASGYELVLSLDRLRGELAIDPLDRTIRASAGMRLSELNTALEPAGLWLPVDLGSDPMLGGMVATNTGGARFIRYGGIRQRVLALTVVLADENGTVLQLGSGLRKDNSRLDLRHLFVGSSGAFGVIAEATLEVARRPAQAHSALLVPASPDASDKLLRWAETRFGDFLSAFEGMSKAAMTAALSHVPGLRNPFAGGVVPDYAILLELASTMPHDRLALDTFLEDELATLFDGADAPLTDALMGDGAALWRLRHSLSEGIRANGPVIGFDLSFRRGRLFAFRRAADRMLAERFPTAAINDFGHIGDGGVHFNVVLPAGADGDHEALIDAVTMLAVEEFGASFSGEHGVGRSNQAQYDRFVPLPIRDYSGRVVQVFAPAPFGTARFGFDCSSQQRKAAQAG